MRKFLFSAVFAALLLFSACSGLSKSEREIALAADCIDRIGQVTYASLSDLNRAEHAYAALSEAQQAKVENAQALAGARAAYDALANVPARGRMDRSKLQIGTYIYRESLWNDSDMQKLTEAGVRLIAGAPYNQTLLDLCEKHGVGVFLHYLPYPVTATPQQYEEAFAAYGDHPAVMAMDIVDEPNAADLPQIGIMTKKAEELFPAGLSYINLFPNYATPQQLGSKNYAEHIAEYVQYVDTDYISYDHYLYANPASRYLENLQIVADACMETGRDLWIVLEVSNTSRLLNRGEMSVQAYGALSYGTKLINWACWTAGWYEPDLQIVDSQDNYTPMYEALKSVNHEILRFSDEYMQFERVETFTIGNAVGRFFATAARPPLSWAGQSVFTNLAMDQNGAAAVGYFEKQDGSAYALLVTNATEIRGSAGENLFSFCAPFALTVHATVNGEKTALSPDENGVYAVSIPNCGGSFITVTRDEAAAFRAEAADASAAAAKKVLDVHTVGFGIYSDNGADLAADFADLGVEFVLGQGANAAAETLAKKNIGLFSTDLYRRGAALGTWGISTSAALAFSDYMAIARQMDGIQGLLVAEGMLNNIPSQAAAAPNGVFAVLPAFIKRSGLSHSVDYAYLGILANASRQSAENGNVFWNVIETRELPANQVGAPTAKQLAWQIDSSFVFGAKKVLFTSYEAMAEHPPLLAAAKESIARWKNWAKIYETYTYQSVYAEGVKAFSPKLPLSDLEVSLASVPAIASLSAEQPTLFGLFTKENATALMLLPGDVEAVLAENFETITATITLHNAAAKVTVYRDGKSETLPVVNNSITVELSGHTGVLITIE